MQSNYMYGRLRQTIEAIQQDCIKNNEKFLTRRTDQVKINLSKSISLVTASNSFFKMFVDYIEFLNNEYLTSDSFFNLTISEGLRSRVKLKESALLKLKKYQNKELESGSLSMNKCLNDLIGMRLILNKIEGNASSVRSELDELKQQKIISRWYFREDGEYRGYHCYFKANNNSFPWELQIWDTKWEIKNLNEHQRHEAEKVC